MLKEPGNLSDLGPAARQAWHNDVVGLVNGYINEAGSEHFRLLADVDWPDGVAVVDWDGFPRILQNCLGDEKAAALCDWTIPTLGDYGRARCQDEYFEWRTVRDLNGKLIRFEGTTELAAYWKVLAGYHPVTTLQILGRFAGETVADWSQVYGSVNPFDQNVTVEQRQTAFEANMVWNRTASPVRSPYNNGQKAIAFLCKPVSSLNAAVALFVYAAKALGKHEGGQEVALNGAEAIATGTQAAIDCRNSDPNMVGRMNHIAWEGRAVAFDDPVGVYIRSFAHEALLDLDGNPIPEEWVQFQRGSRSVGGAGEERSQRIVIEVPEGLGFVLGDLEHRDTEQRIDNGYQLAELTKLACYFKTSSVGEVVAPRQFPNVGALANCSSNANCSVWKSLYTEFENSVSTPAPTTETLRRESQEFS